MYSIRQLTIRLPSAIANISQLPPPAWSSFIPFRDSSRSSFGVQPAPGGISAWFTDRIQGFKNRNNRTAAGAYEGAGATGRGARRGFGPLDPDEAWDSRVGAEADAFYYNEEQELGLHPGQNAGQNADQHQPTSSRLNVSNANTSYLGSGAYGGSSYDMNVPTDANAHDEPRGRSRDRSPNTNTAGGLNPFDDEADPSNMSLRGVSPRPITDAGPHAHDADKPDSPTERRSMFRENV